MENTQQDVIQEDEQKMDAEQLAAEYSKRMLKGNTTLTSVRMSTDDWFYCKRQGLKFSEIFRIGLAQTRGTMNNELKSNAEQERIKKEKWMDMFYKMQEFISKENPELYNKFLGDKNASN